MGVACRTCDGSKESVKKDEDGIVISRKVCSRCNGSGEEPGPSKGGKRRFGKRPKPDDEELTHEEMVRAFLAKHGQ